MSVKAVLCGNVRHLRAFCWASWSQSRPGASSTPGTVAFCNAGTKKMLRHDLVETDQGWRINDIGSPDVPSLLRFLAACR